MGEIPMEDIEKLYQQKNKLNHPTIEDVANQHNQLLNDMLSFPTKNTLEINETSTSPLRTPNDMYKDYLVQQLKTYKEKTTKEE
jgi:hypothetical protein